MKLRLGLIVVLLSCVCNADEIDCDNAITTYDMNRCAAKEVEAAEILLEQYLKKAKEKFADDSAVFKSIENGQGAWLTYRKTHCDSVREVWSGGTIRGVMTSGCKLQLTKERTHTIWADYLTYMDSTPPLLPEPK